jgi:primosomal protein N' (replication factor Y)
MLDDLFSLPQVGIARVALPVPVDRLFDYAIPAALAPEVGVGHRVRVPFETRILTGVVVELAEHPSEEARGRLREIESVIDLEPVLSPSLITILREEAKAVLCSVGVALAAALPPGSAPSAVPGMALTPRGREALRLGAATEQALPVLELLAEGPLPSQTLRRRIGSAYRTLPLLERDRLVAPVRIERGPRVRAASVRFAALNPGVDVDAACEKELSRAPSQAALLRELAVAGPLETSVLAQRFRGAARLLRSLVARGLVMMEARPAPVPMPAPMALGDHRVPPQLTEAQRSACRDIGAAISGRRSETFLLHGVTGSGKTEVYLRAVAEALNSDRQALILVPEITLTHQIVGRLRARFGDRLAVLHSGLRPSERLAQWERLRRGQTPIAVGARSALFAPIEKLGVIVIDEEHDSAYKNEEGFRYHARSLATRRARAADCPLVLGSATPSLETRYAAERNHLRRLSLPTRIGGRPLPAVELVDLAREQALLPRGRKLILSAALQRAMRQALNEKGQCILFLNRRGFSTHITCFDCHYVERCNHCDIALTYHAGEGRLRCHYCDFAKPPADICPSCGAPETALLGIGTERLEEEVRRHFPDARIARLDRDSAARRGVAEAILRDLGAGALDVLIGTQMVAKGHDFPGVQLVGVVNADLGLHFPDFRAAERTFQLLTQVAGRAGRGGSPGRVIVQSFNPHHYAIQPVADHDYERFYAEELAHRATLGYPPLGNLAQVVVSGTEEAAVRAASSQLAAAAPSSGTCELLGPAPAPIARLRDRYRFQLLIKGSEYDAVWRIARHLVMESEKLPAAIRARVDVNPVDML